MTSLFAALAWGSVVAVLGLAVLRIHLIVSGYLGRWPGRKWAGWATQVSIGCGLLGTVLDPFFGLGAILVPILIPVVLYSTVPVYWEFMVRVAPAAIAVAAVVLGLVWSLRWRRHLVVLAILTPGISGIGVAEIVSRKAMCDAAREQEISEFRRHSFLWSLMNTPREFQIEVHGVSDTPERRMIWSYRDMAWVDVTESTAFAEVARPVFAGC